MIESLLAYHCAPALAGIKPANLATCQKSHSLNIYSEIARLNQQLNQEKIYLEIICECEKRVLIMVYRKNILERHLQSHQNRLFLSQFGYCKHRDMAEDINHLKKRLQSDVFPHEIGVMCW